MLIAMDTRFEADRLKEFETRIDNGEKIEPGDWMPEAYRNNLLRMMSQHAHSEIVGQLPEGKWIPHAPGFMCSILKSWSYMTFRMCE